MGDEVRSQTLRLGSHLAAAAHPRALTLTLSRPAGEGHGASVLGVVPVFSGPVFYGSGDF